MNEAFGEEDATLLLFVWYIKPMGLGQKNFGL